MNHSPMKIVGHNHNHVDPDSKDKKSDMYTGGVTIAQSKES